MSGRWVYQFGGGKADGGAKDKALLGGKGANLAEMTRLGLPVPPGFSITTAVCRHYTEQAAYPDGLDAEVTAAIAAVGAHTGTTFGDAKAPLLVSVRSGAPVSMPGMMDTILNLGLSPATVAGLAAKSGNPRFAWDCYRRFIAMYGEVVLGVVPADENDDSVFERLLHDLKSARGTSRDSDLSAGDLETLCAQYKQAILDATGAAFPDDPVAQLWGAIGAVMRSWNNPRADVYRKMNDIPSSMGTAVTVQAMVFGNLGESSATGVCFTRDASTGEKILYGEYLANAQGEDVVAGIRTPEPVAKMAQTHPAAHTALVDVCNKLEAHFRDMQDLEFTVQENRLYMLQARSGKRTGRAMVKIAVDMVHEGLIDEKAAILRIDPAKLDEILHPTIDPKHRPANVAKGLPASPGAAIGKIVFTARAAEAARAKGEDTILVRTETSPEDIHGMKAAVGILTARGGMTCVGGETRILTDRGLLSAESAFAKLEAGEALRILSVDARTMRPIWRDIIAAGRRESPAIDVSVSQTGRVSENTLRLTEDHKLFVLHERKLTKKPVRQVLDNDEFALVVDEIPAFGETRTSPALAYVAGAILSDGYVRLTPTKGAVTFIQKPTEEKAAFIAAVERSFMDAFGVPFTYVRERETVAVLSGREIRGSVEDRICFRRAPAARLAWIREHLTEWVLSLDRVALQYFLAGYVDGDGTYAEESSAVRLQISVSGAKITMLEGVALACLRLGILPQITSNRDNYTLQIAENVDAILAFTQRVRAEIPPRAYESRCLSVTSLFSDISDRVNYMGRVKEAIKRNLMFGVEKIRRDLLPLCPPDAYQQLEGVLGSALRSYRIKQVSEPSPTVVYNFEVDASEELDKNYVAFSSRLTPVLISNSHAAVVARGMGTCCITGCTALRVEAARGFATIQRKDGDITVKAGQVITLDGSTGEVFIGALPLAPAAMSDELGELMSWVDKHRRLKVRTNADTPMDARTARAFGAEGIGLCRTEHMFFQPDRILAVREMILAADEKGRRAALAKILPMQEGDFADIFTEMNGLPVTIRLLDPPLHEFLPHSDAEIAAVAADMGTSAEVIAAKVKSLTEANPMLGHRGCRLAITFPEIYETQAEAIALAAVRAAQNGVAVHPEIMIPFVIVPGELEGLRARVAAVVTRVFSAAGVAIPYTIGTMIELPRACLVAAEIAEHADFFSFGTNDLTQSTLGLSRDDVASFLPAYLDAELLPKDPFVTLDAGGVGQLIELAVGRGRGAKPGLKVGVCGEHGGDPASVAHFHRYGLDYVSCSPFRVPIARVAAARAALESP